MALSDRDFFDPLDAHDVGDSVESVGERTEAIVRRSNTASIGRGTRGVILISDELSSGFSRGNVAGLAICYLPTAIVAVPCRFLASDGGIVPENSRWMEKARSAAVRTHHARMRA